MNQRNELIDILREKLASLGLTSYEITVYLTLLREGPLSAGEIAKRSGIPHSRVYDIIHRLDEKDLVEIFYGKPKKVKAVDPNIALYALVERKKRKLDRLCNHALSLINTVILAGKQAEKTTWVIETSLAEVVSHLILKARHQLLLASDHVLIDELSDELCHVSKNGVNVTVICYDNIEKLGSKDKLVQAGVELYVRKAYSLTIVLIDFLAGAISSPSISYSIMTTEPVLIRALMDLFYSSIVNTSSIVAKPPEVRGRFVSIWAIINKIEKGRKLRVNGIDLKTGKEVIVEGVVEDKIIEDGVVCLLLRTEKGIVKVGGLGAMLEDIEGLIFEVI